MAKRLAMKKEKQRDQNTKDNLVPEVDNGRRRSSKFLRGTSIPNSIIRGDLNEVRPAEIVKDHKTIRRERNEFIDKMLMRLQPQKQKVMYEDNIDGNTLVRLRKKFQEKSADNERSVKDSQRLSQSKRSISAPQTDDNYLKYGLVKKTATDSKLIQKLLNSLAIDEQKTKQALIRETPAALDITNDSSNNSKAPKTVRKRKAKQRSSINKDKLKMKEKPQRMSSVQENYSERPAPVPVKIFRDRAKTLTSASKKK